MNKRIDDYDMIETICGNDQACSHHVVRFGDSIGTQLDDNMGPKEFPPTKHFNDMFFGEANVHINEFPLIHSQSNPSEPTSATSPTYRRKGKVKGKSNVKDDALRKLATTIRNAFESVRSNHW